MLIRVIKDSTYLCQYQTQLAQSVSFENVFELLEAEVMGKWLFIYERSFATLVVKLKPIKCYVMVEA